MDNCSVALLILKFFPNGTYNMFYKDKPLFNTNATINNDLPDIIKRTVDMVKIIAEVKDVIVEVKI